MIIVISVFYELNNWAFVRFYLKQKNRFYINIKNKLYLLCFLKRNTPLKIDVLILNWKITVSRFERKLPKL